MDIHDTKMLVKAIGILSDATTAEHLHSNGESVTGEYDGPVLEVPSWIESHGYECVNRKQWNGNDLWILYECPFCGNTDKCATLIQWPDGGVSFWCMHNSCKDKKWRDLQALHGEEPKYKEAGCTP